MATEFNQPSNFIGTEYDDHLLQDRNLNAVNELPVTGSTDNSLATINFEKKIFDAKKAKENLNTEFTELNYKKYNVEDFFILYKQLFYDMPKKGLYSHQKIVDKSKEYIGGYKHPKNKDINSIYFQIQNALDKLEEIENRHSLLKTGNILKQKDSNTYYYYQDNKKRKIEIELPFIIEYNGYPSNADIAIPMESQALSKIPLGRPIRSLQDIEKQIKVNIKISSADKKSLINKYGTITIDQEDSGDAVEIRDSY